MVKFLLLWSFALLINGVFVLGQDCSKPPKDLDGDKCCDPVKWEDVDVMKQCEKTWSEKHHCACECILNATNIVVNGQVKSDALKTFIENSLKQDPIYIPVAIKAFEECYPMAKAKYGDTIRIGGCSALSGIATECMFNKMFLNCPADKFKATNECTEMRAFVTKCPISVPTAD